MAPQRLERDPAIGPVGYREKGVAAHRSDADGAGDRCPQIDVHVTGDSVDREGLHLAITDRDVAARRSHVRGTGDPAQRYVSGLVLDLQTRSGTVLDVEVPAVGG